MRRLLLAASRSPRLENAVRRTPVSQRIVSRFVAGEDTTAAVQAAADLVGQGLLVTIDHLGEDMQDRSQVEFNRDAYVRLLRRLAEAGLTERVEVSVKLSAIGQALPDGEAISYWHAWSICEAASQHGTTVTLDMEDHTTTDSTLRVLHRLRADFPSVGAVLQAYLRRTEADCRDLAHAGSRVRLCKGAYAEPASVAFQRRGEVDRSYARCMSTLMSGEGYPMLATHDPRLIDLGTRLAHQHGRKPGEYEFQMLHGVRPREQLRLGAAGEKVRVYVPYGVDWYGYLMRRLAERPANLRFFLRSLATRS